MSFYFFVVIWFVCKCYVVEDCKRKFCLLGILLEYFIVFLCDIFGFDVNYEKGFIDFEGCMDFDVKFESLENVWNLREKILRGIVFFDLSKVVFYKYFVVYVVEDMKKKMIFFVRKCVGLGEVFFYNNVVEFKY